MKIDLKQTRRTAVAFACGFASCWILLHALHPARPAPAVRPTAPLVHYTQLGSPTLEIRLPAMRGGLIPHPIYRDPTLPHPPERSLDLIDTTPQPVLNLDERK